MQNMAGFGNALSGAQPKEMTELESALDRLHRTADGLRQARSDLRDRLNSVLRLAIPQPPSANQVSPCPPPMSAIGGRIHNIADTLSEEIETVRDIIARLAV